MTFDQFVLMYSVFCDRAPREMKIHYAFMIYGKLFFQIKNEYYILNILNRMAMNRRNDDKEIIILFL